MCRLFGLKESNLEILRKSNTYSVHKQFKNFSLTQKQHGDPYNNGLSARLLSQSKWIWTPVTLLGSLLDY